MNVNPIDRHLEAGFLFSPITFDSAVFDAAAPVDMPGNSNSSFFGWAEGNVIALTSESGAPFSLFDVLLGPSSLAGGPASITLVGIFVGGGTMNVTFSNLTTATLAPVNWTNLLNVEFSTTDDAAMDNVNTVVPAPGAAALGLLALPLLGRRRV
jgi:hypothetical protein